MNIAFTKDADFSGMVDPTKFFPPYISEVIHKSYVDMNEEGTEVASVTMVVMAPTGSPRPVEIPAFRTDHPFLFIIQDSQTKSILFIRRVINPQKG